MPKESFLDFLDEIAVLGQDSLGQRRSKGETKKLIAEAYRSCGKETQTVSFQAWKNIPCEWPGFDQGMVD